MQGALGVNLGRGLGWEDERSWHRKPDIAQGAMRDGPLVGKTVLLRDRLLTYPIRLPGILPIVSL